MKPPAPSPLPFGHLSSYRVETLADGVFAIAMTLLVLDLKVPAAELVAGAGGLAAALVTLWPRLLAYVMSFIILGIYWTAHHYQYHTLKQADRVALWINLLFLLFVTALPFSASLVASYPERTAILVYSANSVAIGLCLFANWSYGSAHTELLRGELDDDFVRLIKLHILFAPFLYALAAPLAFVDIRLSVVVLVLAPLLNLTGLSISLPAWILGRSRRS